MKMLALVILGALFNTSPAGAMVKEEAVEYRDGDTVFKGYLAYDHRQTGKRPGVLVVHEWWGQNAHAQRRARMLARLGYVALAVDMYGDGKNARHPQEAGGFAQQVLGSREGAEARFRAGLDALKKFPLTDPERVAAVGYCFGGSVVLNMAVIGLDLKGVVSFHGGLTLFEQDAGPGGVKAKILVCHGGDDGFATREQIAAFKKRLDELGADYRFVVYPGGKHSFTNPDADKLAREFNLPIGYHKQADEQSWQDMKDFLAKAFAP